MTEKEKSKLYARFKQIFNTTMTSFNEEVPNENKEQVKVVFKCTNRDLKNRIQATTNFFNTFYPLFQEKYDDEFLIEQIGRTCSCMMPSDEVYSTEYYTYSAFAIWYLDEILKIGRLDDIIEFLPYEYLDANFKMVDSVHSDDLIARVAYVCKNANGSTADEFNSLMKILNENAPDVLKNATERYVDEIYRMLVLFLKHTKLLMDKRNALEQETERALKSNANILMVKPTNFSIERAHEIAEEFEENFAAMTKLLTSISFAGSLKKDACKAMYQQAYSDELYDYTLDNPFEICAIFHISKIKQSDFYWCFGPALNLFIAAARRLPWCGDFNIPSNLGTQYRCASMDYLMEYDSDIFDTSKDKKSLVNKAQLFYAVSGGVLPPRIEKAYNSAELLLANNGLTGSELEQFIGHIRHVSAMADHYDDFDEFNDEYSDEEVDVPVDSLEISDEENEQKIDDTKESTEDVLRAEIKFLKEQNKRILDEAHLHEAREKRLEKETVSLKNGITSIQRELSDLRNVVFNSQTGDFNNEPQETLPISYPYTAKGNIVVFGGHESWSKAIKPRFTNVKFIYKDATPNAEQIKNANVIWIQTNALAHTNFYKIIDVARVHGVPVRYFSYASAVKCAEQIVLDDLG